MAALRQAVLGTGGFNCRIRYHGVTRGGIDFLFLQHFLTHAAALSFGFTVLGAGGCNCFIYYLGVTRGFDRYRFIYDLFTVPAFCFLCPSVLGTSCSLCQFTSINIQMSAGRDHLLRCQHRIAVIAVAALGQTGLCTGCRFAFVWDRKMAARRCAFLLYFLGAGVCFPVQGVLNPVFPNFIISAGRIFHFIGRNRPAITFIQHFVAFLTPYRHRITCIALARRW